MAVTKISRNELCPCGSGKKYKKCCLALEQQPIQTPAVDNATAGLLQTGLAHQQGGRLG